MDRTLSDIGVLPSGMKIKMKDECGFYICYLYPATKEGQKYVYNELINGRDVEIVIERRKELMTYAIYLPALGFNDALKKYRKLSNQPTEYDEAL
ncbi:hypothetical protein QPI28_003082 [Vibrio parahaemolyticus]|nr:hypothetical protein [Vibrio parahaemolyticus]ELA7175489.1 hypothetical protein [Vibrio parahaemolyticus]ELA7177065.1 hypothetical protein [Vibrio parahaemolyticus]ELA7457875.1 hypothetical protein [Vibrio parahaemolyticus]ELA7459543.1 hypothetical protein [Vibrio parahaemolyticus]